MSNDLNLEAIMREIEPAMQAARSDPEFIDIQQATLVAARFIAVTRIAAESIRRVARIEALEEGLKALRDNKGTHYGAYRQIQRLIEIEKAKP